MKAAAPIEQALHVEWISNLSALDAVERPWRALERVSSHRTHLSAFDFIVPWYRHYAGEYGGAPLVGLAWQGAELAGVAPLTIRRGRVGGIPVRRVEFAPNDSVAGEFLVPDGQPHVVTALLDALVRHVTFDVICLNGLDPASDQLLTLRAAAPRHHLAVHAEEHAYAMVDLRDGYEAYRSRLSGNTRRKIAQKTRRIEEIGARIEGVLFSDGVERLDDAIDRLIAITEASYKLQGSRLADAHRGFLADVVRRFGAREMLCLPILSIGGKDAAFVLGVVERGCFYDVSLAYDERFEKLGPGVYLMQEMLRRLAAAGVHTVISHGAHEYKKHWATAFVPQKRIFLFPPRPRAAATRLVRFALQPLWRRHGAQPSLGDANLRDGHL